MTWHSRRVSNRREAFITFQPSDFSCAAWTFVPVWNTTLCPGVCVDQEGCRSGAVPIQVHLHRPRTGTPAAPGSIFTSSGSPDAFVWPVYRLTSINCLMAPCRSAPPPWIGPAGLCFSPLPPEVFTRRWNRRRVESRPAAGERRGRPKLCWASLRATWKSAQCVMFLFTVCVCVCVCVRKTQLETWLQ